MGKRDNPAPIEDSDALGHERRSSSGPGAPDLAADPRDTEDQVAGELTDGEPPLMRSGHAPAEE